MVTAPICFTNDSKMEGVPIKILGRATLSLGNLWWTETKISGVRWWPDRVSTYKITQ